MLLIIFSVPYREYNSQNASGKNMLYYAYLVAAQPLPARRQALLTVKHHLIKHHLIKHQLLPVIDFTMAFQLPQRKNTSSGFPTVTRSGSCSVVATGYKRLNRLGKKLQCGLICSTNLFHTVKCLTVS